MIKYLRLLLVGVVILVLVYFILGYASSYVGWYGYKKWKYRVATSDIDESKRRGVFVKELHFQIDSFSTTIEGFIPYIEKGFKYGRHSSEVTELLTNSNYPYQLSFNFRSSQKMGLMINEDQLMKFDSSGKVRGFLKQPFLKDTIVVQIIGEKIRSGIIKVWE